MPPRVSATSGLGLNRAAGKGRSREAPSPRHAWYPIMPIALVICAATVFVLCAWYFQRRHRALEAHMTQQVKERYAAYVELEQRVLAALGEFDRLESTFEAEIRKSR